MKSSFLKTLAVLLVLPLTAPAFVITNHTAITPGNTSYEGADVIVSNATLTVDGPHTFASLVVGPGGVVTHTASANGTLTTTNFITNEPQLLVGTNEVTLANPDIIPTSVVVKDSSGTVTYQTNVDFVVRNVAPDTFLSRSETSTIPDGATVLVTYQLPDGTTPAGLNLTITQNLYVAVGGGIDANGRGITSGVGTGLSLGNPASGAGAGHGGYGGWSSSNALGGGCYGVIPTPTTLGSRGGSGVGGFGGLGGGGIRLNVAGAAQIDGVISANGLNATNSRSGGGSGGSIWLNAQTVSGSGTFTALGGNGEPIHGGGGGGGHIALQMDTNIFTGTATAYGGLGWKAGGAGTVYTKLSSDAGVIYLDNNERAGTNSLIANPNESDVIIRSRAVGAASGNWSARHVIVNTNGLLVPASAATALNVTATSITVAAGGILSADGVNTATGTTTSGGSFAGGGHGGAGGNGTTNNGAGGLTSGDQINPTTSGGRGGGDPQAGGTGGGAGGGAIRLSASQLILDGNISANGRDGQNGGGGAGGSIWITALTFSGNGGLTADGGPGNSVSGGGGGGRIAIFVTNTNQFTGSITTGGAGGGNRGTAGTIYLESPAPGGGLLRELIVDNGGFPAPNARTNTILNSISSGLNLKIRNGATAQTSIGANSVASLLVGANSSLLLAGQLTVTSNAVVEAGGRLHADGFGSSSLGTGVGTTIASSLYYCGGGGHGGYGGNGGTNLARGGNSYGSATTPTTAGSNGGGSGSSFTPFGGMGGGALRLIVNGILTNNGIISSDGKMGSGNFAGGGAGGSVYLTGGRLYGTGSFSANGGAGLLPGGGGGGGGRIALIMSSNFFGGSITAYGGSGANYGGAGTVFLSTNISGNHLYVDNGGNFGTNTTTSETSYTGDLTVAGGGSFVVFFPGTGPRHVTIRTNGTLLAAISTSQQFLTLSGNLTIDAGGVLSLDGRGNGPAAGNGFGYTSGSPRGGGGHGGYGGMNSFSYGNAYDSITGPSLPGSGGGNGSGSSFSPLGGAGGGALRLQFLGSERVLTVNGRLSANGLPGELNSGGGSGGSLQLSPYVLTGTGTIAANGGAGNGTAGGGGGGRIAITYNSNLFTGQFLAAGGSGAMAGGAGTIYTKANSAGFGSLLIDNASQPGTNTPLSSAFILPTSPFNLTISGGASIFALTQLPQLSNLVIRTAGSLTMRSFETNVFLDVLRDATIATSGSINVNGKGYGRGLGVAPGTSVANQGAGGGHGGAGGNTLSGAVGGTNYDVVSQPELRGSGGGAGANIYISGSEGGGAVRIMVGGTLTLDGSISANGNPGIQDDSGGGAGGSVWVSAGRLIGAGLVSATGGDGDLFGGGGGGGGRIAIYSPTNQFSGSFNVLGGSGANNGLSGTLFISTNLGPIVTISGTITTTNAQPVTGAVVQAVGVSGTITTTTDSAGNYTLEVISGWPGGTVIPASGTNVFLPSSRSYNTTTVSLGNQNFTMFPSLTPVASVGNSSTNLSLSWNGFAGVTYLPQWSTNLVDWSFLDVPIPGSNGVMQIPALPFDAPAKYFRIQASY